MVSFPNKGQTSCTLGSPLNFSVQESMCFEREIRTRKKGLEWVTGTRTKCVWGWRRKWHFFFLFFFSFFLFFPKVNGAESFDMLQAKSSEAHLFINSINTLSGVRVFPYEHMCFLNKISGSFCQKYSSSPALQK